MVQLSLSVKFHYSFVLLEDYSHGTEIAKSVAVAFSSVRNL